MDMAIRIQSSSLILVHQFNKPNPQTTTSSSSSSSTKRVLVLARKDSQHHTPSIIQIKSSIKLQKVFEDKTSGVVCYRDENGEITCEGYDEGPRFLHQGFPPNQRDAEAAIVDFLKRSLLGAVNGAGKIK